MGAATKPGLFKVWYEDVQNFGTTVPRQGRGPLPHLGMGAGLVTIFVSSFFAGQLASALAIIIAYGPHAYFQEGLHIVDWKHDWLSNGGYLSFTGKLIEVILTLVLWFVLIYAADFSSMCIQQIIRRNGRWLEVAFRLLGGAALLAFSAHLYRHGNWGIHPIPFSALLGGSILLLKGLALIFKTGATQTVQ